MKCLFDGVEFEPKRATAKFCSSQCRVKYARNAGADPDTGEIITKIKIVPPDVPPIDTYRLTRLGANPKVTAIKVPAFAVVKDLPEAAEIDYSTIDNPFDRPDPEGYDREKALAAFKKMGLEQVRWLSTGLPAFDRLTKIPRGRITQIQGPYGVGKTTLCLNMIAGMRDSKVLYIDSEAALNPDLLVDLRINHANFTLYNKSAKLEDIADVIRIAAKSGEYDVIIFDSLAQVTTETIAEGKLTDANIGQKAKLMHKLVTLVQMDLKQTDTALVVINQEREMLGTYVPTKYTPGGMAIPYAASLMVSLKTIKSWRFGKNTADTKAKKFVGQEVEATIIKSKVNTPWRVAKFKLYYPNPREDEETQF